MGLLKKAKEYREHVSNEEMRKLADWYIKGPEPLGKPITEKKLRENASYVAQSLYEFVERLR